jgi:hypothetical protein
MEKPIIYRKWYPKSNRWYWMVRPCNGRWSQLTDDEKALRDRAYIFINRMNEKEGYTK